MGGMALCRTIHTAPEQGQEPKQEQGRKGYVPIFQVLRLFQVVCFNDISMAFRCPVLVPDTTSVNGFCIISVPSHCDYTIWPPIFQRCLAVQGRSQNEK